MSDSPSQNKRRTLPLEAPSDLEPKYANVVRIAHTPAEMVFDFAQMLPGTRQARVQTRVLMSPLGAKLFHRALSENLAKYEAAFGEIAVPGDRSLEGYERLFRPPDEDPS